MEPVALEDVLVALQKTFSRVSASSREVPEENARALVTGVVEFEISSSFELGPDPSLYTKGAGRGDFSSDHLIQSANGSITLSLKGQIATDLRVGPDEEARA